MTLYELLTSTNAILDNGVGFVLNYPPFKMRVSLKRFYLDEKELGLMDPVPQRWTKLKVIGTILPGKCPIRLTFLNDTPQPILVEAEVIE